MPTSKPPASAARDKLLLMMSNLKANMAKRLQELKEEEIMPIADFTAKVSTIVFSNEESLQKVKSNLDVMTQNISKLETRLTIQKEIYSTQQKDINRCVSDIASHDQNNKVIISEFKEKLDKAILDTKQVDTKLSETCNKALSLNFQAPDSRIDDIAKIDE
eukprot:1866540-Ditylum_brightwellii.AAC.1